jgi:hypothetical protein
MKRFELGKNAAIGLAVALLGTLSLITVFSLCERIYCLRANRLLRANSPICPPTINLPTPFLIEAEAPVTSNSRNR